MKIERKKPQHFKAVEQPFEIRADNGTRTIEGFASTPGVDSYDEIVLPSAFTELLPAFKQFPVLLVNHVWRSMPIGKVVVAEVSDAGLHVEATISKTSEGNDVWTLIQEGVLKAFSIGFNSLAREEDDEAGILTHTKVELLEISIVNVPANREALFQEAKSRGLKSLFTGFETKQPQSAEGGGDMDQTQVKAVVDDAVDSKKVAITAAATEAVNATLEPKLASIRTDLESLVAGAKDAAKNVTTPAEFKELVERVTAVDEKLKLTETRQLEILKARGEAMVMPEAIEDEARSHPYGPEYGALSTLPLDYFGKDKDMVTDWRNARDAIALCDQVFKHQSGYRGPRSLKSWKRYSELNAQFGKAMSATGTGYGDEWMPTDLSGNLTDLIELNTVVASMIPVFPMPTNPMELPYLAGHLTVYMYGEPTTDFPTEIPKSTIATGKRTMTAKGFAVATTISKDATEDSLIAMLPIIQQDIALKFAQAFDDAYVNGDTSATHRDTGLTVASNSHLKAFDGLRHLANADGVEYNCQTVKPPNTTDFEAADFMKVLQQMGPISAPERRGSLKFLLSLQKYWVTLLFPEVKTADKRGSDGAILTGVLDRLLGVQLLITAYLRDDYNSDGLYTGSGSASLFLAVYGPGFQAGSRRAVTVESQPNIKTQQIDIVATARRAFREIRASTSEYPVAAGINVPE